MAATGASLPVISKSDPAAGLLLQGLALNGGAFVCIDVTDLRDYLRWADGWMAAPDFG